MIQHSQKKALTGKRKTHSGWMFFFFLLPLLFSTPVLSASDKPSSDHKALQKKLKKILRHHALRKAQVGVMVKSLDHKKTIFEKDSQKALIPASNVKVLTTYTALHNLGINYRFKTYFLTDRYTKPGWIQNLYVRGEGDPHLVIERLWRIAGDLQARGVKGIAGDIIIDGSFFDAQKYPPGWPQNPTSEAYYAPNAALAVNFSSVAIYVWPGSKAGTSPQVFIDPNIDFIQLDNQAKTIQSSGKKKMKIERLTRTGGDFIRVSGHMPVNSRPMVRYRHISQPLQYAGAILKYVLEGRGMEISGKVRTGSLPGGLKEIFVEESPPLGVLVKAVNKHSNNFMAEQILKTLGARNANKPGSTAEGIHTLKKSLKEMGIGPEEYRLENGSGLGRGNRISAHALVRVLETAWENPLLRPEFLSSLALGGIDGTLEDRMGNLFSQPPSQLQESLLDSEEDPPDGKNISQEWKPKFTRIRAKTGSLNHVSCISGYVIGKNGDKLAFSILMNGFPEEKHQSIHHIQDQILEALLEERG